MSASRCIPPIRASGRIRLAFLLGIGVLLAILAGSVVVFRSDRGDKAENRTANNTPRLGTQGPLNHGVAVRPSALPTSEPKNFMSIPQESWPLLELDLVEWSFALSDSAAQVLNLSNAEFERLSGIFDDYRQRLRENESARFVLKHEGPKLVISIPGDPNQGEALRNAFQAEVASAIGEQRAQFLTSTSKKAFLAATADFGGANRTIVLTPNEPGQSKPWEVKIVAQQGIQKSQHDAAGGGSFTFGAGVSRSYAFDAIPEELSHLLQAATPEQN